MENGESAHYDRILPKLAFKIGTALAASLGILFSNRYNAQFGDVYFLAMLVLMCKGCATANKARADLKDRYGKYAPTARWFTGKLSEIGGEAEKECRQALAKTVRLAVKSRIIPRLVISAMDFHDIPFTGKTRDDNTVPGKSKGGTSKFEGCDTMAVVSLPHVLQVGAVRMKTGTSKAEYVLDLTSQLRDLGLRSSVHLMDKEFCTVEVIRALYKKKERFLMAIKKTGGVNRAIDEFKAHKRASISRYAMTASDGSPVEFWLVIRKRIEVKDGKRQFKYLTFATNVGKFRMRRSLDELIDMYSLRWSEENGYKSIESARARTGGLNHDARTFLFFSMILCNLWCMTNLERRWTDPRPSQLLPFYEFVISVLQTIDEFIGPPFSSPGRA